MEEVRKAGAQIFIELSCTCPHCGAMLDFYDYIHAQLCLDVLAYVGHTFEVSCEECGKEFDMTIEL